MAFERAALDRAGILAARDLPRCQEGSRARTAGLVIVRQRPGTAKGFCFLTLEDETGLANIIVTPKRFEKNRGVLLGASLLLVEGRVQNRDGVTAIRGERFEIWAPGGPALSRDFH
jgi:error-prone DNA polymerase